MLRRLLLKIRFEGPPGLSCGTCLHFANHEMPDDDPEEPNGYCCHPNHSDSKKSPHWEYGGHWTHKNSWCSWHESIPSDK